MSKNIVDAHKKWLRTPGKKGQKHNETNVRAVAIPPKKSFDGWDISRYKNKWSLIEKKLI